ncbi:hypothetical protein M427DRAFT_94967 [Gonapodya prolifera JEL478]|uniref:Protein SYS1 n=1 Tax=Gonapodya prolifera (strain JEL478) TaxID=1344416 RepID=A0A139AT19_GONPJ|nr:hypothetical protein M427DRAFT_94967 [Gonapodya prolifera JEL478]|eukprot:KXS19859.1 hypothetical protein M427DRAFT_94967 [Gonapodya prolifera JEL478]
MPPSFRASHWDPVLIIGQIVCLQTAWYLSLAAVQSLLHILAAAPWTPDILFNWSATRLDTALGWAVIFGDLLAACFGCFLLLWIVERTRLCLDFAGTLHLIHLSVVSFHTGSLPVSLTWYLTFLASCVIMVVGGEHLCMKYEMEPIALSGGGVGAVKRKQSSRSITEAEIELLAIQEDGGSSSQRQSSESQGRSS